MTVEGKCEGCRRKRVGLPTVFRSAAVWRVQSFEGALLGVDWFHRDWARMRWQIEWPVTAPREKTPATLRHSADSQSSDERR
jgi:hypothetical protein